MDIEFQGRIYARDDDEEPFNGLVTFKVENMADGTGAIRYALAAVKNVGAGAMQGVVAERDRARLRAPARSRPARGLRGRGGRAEQGAPGFHQRRLEHRSRSNRKPGLPLGVQPALPRAEPAGRFA